MKRLIILVLVVGISVTASAQSGLKASAARGKKVYEQYCLPCHQVDGSGVPNLNPPLIKTSFVLGDQKKLVQILLNGLNEEIEVNGDTYANPMPPFATVLKDEEIADVLTFIRNSFGNKASMISAAQVKTIRNTK